MGEDTAEHIKTKAAVMDVPDRRASGVVAGRKPYFIL